MNPIHVREHEILFRVQDSLFPLLKCFTSELGFFSHCDLVPLQDCGDRSNALELGKSVKNVKMQER